VGYKNDFYYQELFKSASNFWMNSQKTEFIGCEYQLDFRAAGELELEIGIEIAIKTPFPESISNPISIAIAIPWALFTNSGSGCQGQAGNTIVSAVIL